MDRYVWAAVVIILALILSGTVLIVTNHSDDAKSAALLVAQGIGFLANFYVSTKAARRAQDNVSEKMDKKIDEVKEAINGSASK